MTQKNNANQISDYRYVIMMQKKGEVFGLYPQ